MPRPRTPKVIDYSGQTNLNLDRLEEMAWMPRCPKTGANIDLHLVTYKDPDLGELAARLQKEGAEAFVNSWNDLIGSITSESERLAG